MLLMMSLACCSGASGEETSDAVEQTKVSRIYIASPFFNDQDDSNVMVHEAAVANLKGVEELETYDFDSMPESDFEGEMF